MAAISHEQQHACDLVTAMLRNLGLVGCVSPTSMLDPLWGQDRVTLRQMGTVDFPSAVYEGAAECAGMGSAAMYFSSGWSPPDSPAATPTGSAAMSISSGPSPPGSLPATPVSPGPQQTVSADGYNAVPSWSLIIAGNTLNLYSLEGSRSEENKGLWHLRNAPIPMNPITGPTVITVHTDRAVDQVVYTPNPTVRPAPFQFRRCASSACAICDVRKSPSPKRRGNGSRSRSR
ncbi:hypothetical protein LTR85_008352 [Meristemomyces frigidus]|nr:hypothetical protein LTR85_008352 [Meristemomyces frigidus]